MRLFAGRHKAAQFAADCLLTLSDSCQLKIETAHLLSNQIGRAEQPVKITEGIPQK